MTNCTKCETQCLNCGRIGHGEHAEFDRKCALIAHKMKSLTEFQRKRFFHEQTKDLIDGQEVGRIRRRVCEYLNVK